MLSLGFTYFDDLLRGRINKFSLDALMVAAALVVMVQARKRAA